MNRVEIVNVDVDGKDYLCSVWFGNRDKLWYGKAMEDEITRLCYAVTKEGLLVKLRMDILDNH